MEMSSQAPPVYGAPVEKKSIWSIMVGVFTAPGETFLAYKQHPRIIIPLIVLIILLAIVGGLTAKQNGALAYDMFKSSELMPPKALADMREAVENPHYIKAALGAPIWPVILGVVEALLAMFLGNVIFAGKAKFKETWGVALLTGLIVALGGLVRVPLVFAKDTLLVSIGPAALMPGKDFTSIVYFFLYTADVFGIWAVIVGGIGYSTIFGVSRGKGYAISIICFLVLTIIIIGLLTTFFSLAGAKITFF